MSTMTAPTGLPWGRALTVEDLELEDGQYVERAHVAGQESYDVDEPFEVSLCPWDLAQDLRHTDGRRQRRRAVV